MGDNGGANNSNIFDKDPFKEFTDKKMREMV
jgi:hypothetical protein